MEPERLGPFDRMELFLFRVTLLASFTLTLYKITIPEIRSVLVPLAEEKAQAATSQDMDLHTCRIAIHDLEGVEHITTVTASNLYEAVALGLRALQENDWVAGLPRELTAVTVCANEPTIEHKIRIADVTTRLRQPGGSPAEVTKRKRLRQTLGQ